MRIGIIFMLQALDDDSFSYLYRMCMPNKKEMCGLYLEKQNIDSTYKKVIDKSVD